MWKKIVFHMENNQPLPIKETASPGKKNKIRDKSACFSQLDADHRRTRHLPVLSFLGEYDFGTVAPR